MKKTLFGFSVIAAALLSTAPLVVYAVPRDAPPLPPPHHERAVRPPFPPFSEEQMAQIQSFEKEYLDASSPLKEQLKEKRLELKALSPNPNTKPEELRQLVRDIIALEKQLDVLKDTFRDNMVNAGIPCPGPKGFPGPHHSLRRSKAKGPGSACWDPYHGHDPVAPCWW